MARGSPAPTWSRPTGMVLVMLAVALWTLATATQAQSPAATRHPIPTTPPGAVATRPPDIWVDPPPAPAGCVAEQEPNDRPEGAILLAAESCVSGELVHERDQDLYFYEVAPEDGLVTWEVTVRGVPGAYTSIHYLPLTSPAGVTPVELAPKGEVARVDSDVWIGMPPGTGQVQLAPGGYLLGISRGVPGYDQDLTEDLGYWVEIRRGETLAPNGDAEPNDAASSATPVAGAFALSGDLEDTPDLFRWTLGPEDVGRPWRLSVRSSLGMPVWVELSGADGSTISYGRAQEEGLVTLHDLALAPGEYVVELPYADGPQPYELWAEPVTDSDIDGEPNDLPEQALTIDPATLTATGRLTSSGDIDQYLVDIGADLATGLVDLTMSWADATQRTLCIGTESGTRIGCADGLDEVAIRGLLVPAGRYRIWASGAGGLDDRYRIVLAASGVAQPVREQEPNDDQASATAVTGAFTVGGDLIGSPDTFAWTVSEADAGRVWHLDTSATPGLHATYDLLAPDGTFLARSTVGQEGTARMWDLRLAAGTYTIALTSGTRDAPSYVLRATPETAPDLDPEPNDLLAQAVPLDPATRATRGRVTTNTDVDMYRFDVDEAMATRLLEVALAWPGPAPRELCLASEFGSVVQCVTGWQAVALTHLQLDPGTWVLQVSGGADPASRYEVRVAAGDPPAPDGETEPNDRDDIADDWDTGLVMRGTSRDGDIDVYRVHVGPGEPMIWRLDIVGRDVERPEWRQPDGTHVGSVTIADDAASAVIEDLYLVSGDHLLTVRGGEDYSLSLTRIGPPDLTAEREPNDDAAHADPLRMAGDRKGRLPEGGDIDVYRFSLSASEHVTLTADASGTGGGGIDLTGAALELEITSATDSLVHVPAPDGGGPTVFDGLLPQADYEVWVRRAAPPSGLPPAGDVTYAIRLERADPFVDPAVGSPASLPAELGLRTDTPEVAAYWRDGQRMDAVLRIASTGTEALDLQLAAATSHHAWRVDLPDGVSVPPGGVADVPIAVRVPADAWRDVPVRVTVRARDPRGAQATAWTEIVPRQDAAVVAPEPWWPIPDELLGGLDAASLALGATSVTQHFRGEEAHDGIVIAGTGLVTSFPNGPVITDVDLAGDDPVPVAGTIIDPLGGAGTFGGRPRAFQLWLSLDGVAWASVLSGELGPQTLEQAFVLPRPVDARFARLQVDTTWGGTTGPVEIGEWKVVATPGWVPSPDPVDIADPVRGGHVVWTAPAIQLAADMLTTADTYVRLLPLQAAKAQDFVIGFADDRAAQVTGLRWEDQVGSDPAARFGSVEVSASLGSPLGPWTPLGTWRLDRAPDGTVAPFELVEAPWIRFLRLTAPGSPDADSRWELPGKLTVLERPTDQVYRSILGQWGQASPRGIHEALLPAPVEASRDDVDVADTPADAAALASGDVAHGRVARSVDTDWYEVTVPADQNTLAIHLATERAGDIRLGLYDATGADVEDRTTVPTDEGTSVVALVEPGETYRVELVQPILSVVFTFDTSSSITPWFPLIRAAIGSFADAVRPGLEAVQVFPFQEPDLLESWSDQAYLVRSGLDAWTTAGGSSALEDSIKRATVTLGQRDGTRAVLAVGDAVGGGFLGGLPAADLEMIRPAIFPVHIGGTSDPVVSLRIMQDLALANGGFYQYATSLAEMERAFDRMATWLRRPADYALSYETSQVAYPPGSIGVVEAEGTRVRIGGVAVELVLDTSGSMLEPLGASTRIAVAKRSLVQLIEEDLPEGLPVALRTFKAGRRSCDTVLTVKLGPLDRARMVKRINRLKLNERTRTPLAAAIEAVADDIGDVAGPRIVVVVTDGAESCKGDPEAAVRSLVEAGFDTTLNIVGLALDDEVLKSRMASWAEAGGGVFFDAQDRAGLSEAIAATLRAPFRVIDETGTVVASGIVGGDPVEVPIGTYRVEVLSDPVITFDEVVIKPGFAAQLEVEGETP